MSVRLLRLTLAVTTVSVVSLSLASAQTRQSSRPPQPGKHFELIPLKYLSVYDVVALFGGKVVDGRRDFMGLTRGGLNSHFRPYGWLTARGYQSTLLSPFGPTVLNLPRPGTRWGTLNDLRTRRGTGAAGGAAFLTQPGLFPGLLGDLGLSLLGWPPLNTVILAR